MTTITAPAFVKEIRYDRETRDYAAYLDGELVSFARSYHQAEIDLDTLVCELLASDATRSATDLDGGSDVEEITADMAGDEPPIRSIAKDHQGYIYISPSVWQNPRIAFAERSVPPSQNDWRFVGASGWYAHEENRSLYEQLDQQFGVGQWPLGHAENVSITPQSPAVCKRDTLGDYWTICRADAGGPCMCDVVIVAGSDERCVGVQYPCGAPATIFVNERTGHDLETSRTVQLGYCEDCWCELVRTETITPDVYPDEPAITIRQIIARMRETLPAPTPTDLAIATLDAKIAYRVRDNPDAQTVRQLAQQHLHSAFSGPAYDVALLDQLADRDEPIPDELGVPTLRAWGATIGIAASDAFWRAFKDAAIGLTVPPFTQLLALAVAGPAPTPTPGPTPAPGPHGPEDKTNHGAWRAPQLTVSIGS